MSRRSFDNNDPNDGGGGGGWITTFADLMSLLLTFFILLYSMSSVDEEKFNKASGSIQHVLSGSGSIIDGGQPIQEVVDSDVIEILNQDGIDQGIIDMHRQVLGFITEEEMNKDVSVNMNERGVFVDIKEAILFDPGSAKIKEGGLVVLEKLEPLINDFDNDIVIEGHTDNVPMSSYLYPSNWELSTARAVSVLRELSENRNVDPRRLSAVGYGEYQPIHANDTPENRAANRRVNILIIFDEESDGKEIEE